MSSLPIVSTAEVLRGATSATVPNLSLRQTRTGLAALTDWLVRLTERAHEHMVRAARADARYAGAPGSDAARFLTDACGGGSRRFEAARALRASVQ
jgi:hypothetical protein